MKCKYKYCKYGGEVEKEIAYKDGKSYYHYKCFEEKELKSKIKDFYYSKFGKKEPLQSINRAIHQLVHDRGFEPSYILFCLNQDIKLNSIFGLVYYLNNKEINDKYKKHLSSKVKVNPINIETNTETKINYKQTTQSLWGDIICQK